jgi:uncharacterized protein YkwD
MRRPSRGVTAVAIALVVAAVGGGVLSRSLRHSGASPSRATAASVLTLLNQQRAAHRLLPLALDANLTRAAVSHSADMLRRGYFAHDGPQGTWDIRIRRFAERAVLGEILEYGSGHYATADGIVTSWMESTPHRRVILTPDLRLIGIGIVVGTFRGQDGVAMTTGDLSSQELAAG